MSKIIDFEAVMRDQMIVTSGRINPSTVKMLIDMGFRITKEQSIYDEAKERELFESTRNAHTVRRNEHGDYVLASAQDAWSGWSQCAQSRAKAGEVGHE